MKVCLHTLKLNGAYRSSSQDTAFVVGSRLCFTEDDAYMTKNYRRHTRLFSFQ